MIINKTDSGIEKYIMDELKNQIDYQFTHNNGKQFCLFGSKLSLEECRESRNAWEKQIEKSV